MTTASIQDYNLTQWALDNNITGGIEIKRVCDICRKPLKYQIFTQEIQFPNIKYINIETWL